MPTGSEDAVALTRGIPVRDLTRLPPVSQPPGEIIVTISMGHFRL